MLHYTRLLRAAVTAALVLVAIGRAAVAGPLEDAQAAYNRLDYATALRLLRPLAEQGVADAQLMLSGMYQFGHGVPKDNDEALKWERRAAEHNATAQFFLGTEHEDGSDTLGVAQDFVEAAKWYRLAADQGFALAQLHLGRMYEKGQGVPQDYVLAYMLYNLAAAQVRGTWVNTPFYANQRDRLAQRMTPAQIAEAQKLAREWKPKPER
jgi:uncharacterized protein